MTFLCGITHVFTEAFPVLSAGEVQVAVKVKVISGQFSHSHDGLLTVAFDWMSVFLLLRLSDERSLQTRDDLALRVQVLHKHSEKSQMKQSKIAK